MRCGAKYRETGCESPTQKRHCKVYVLSDGRRCAGHSGETGEGFAEMARGDTPQNTKSGYSVPFLIGIPQAERYAVHKNVCTKAKKWLWCFFILARRSGTAPFFTP